MSTTGVHRNRRTKRLRERDRVKSLMVSFPAMRRIIFSLVACAAAMAAGPELPVRGLHLSAPKPADVALLERFIRNALPREGVNTLVLEINYRYQFTKRPELADPDALSREELARLAAACRDSKIRLIPLMNLLGHQSWAATNFGLLRAHPEFDETPKKYPTNEGIYCRSYCPLHPDVHNVVFDAVDEVLEITGADALHAGMDEVFILGDEDCPRCRGRLRAELFAEEVQRVRNHLAKSGKELWIWADRYLDGTTTGLGKWEGSFNETYPALRQAPKDVVMCDWHYEKAVPTAPHFALQGFRVVSSPWRKPDVALGQLEQMRLTRTRAGEPLASRMLGMLQTSWCDSGAFARAYFGEDPNPRKNVAEAVQCFRDLFAAMR